MSFSLGTLTAYTEQQRLPLITKAVFAARTASLFTKQVGIKSAAALNLMDTDAALAAGTACGWTASGTTTFLSLGTSNYVLTAGASAPQYVAQSTLTAGAATNIAGGIASQIPYQTGAGATSFIANGTSGQMLKSGGTGAPSWANVDGGTF